MDQLLVHESLYYLTDGEREFYVDLENEFVSD